MLNALQVWHKRLLSEEVKERGEHVIVTIAIISFLLHLLIIGLIDFGIIEINDYSELFINPISAIYTPFSFILIYEAYLLIYYLPRSITIYIAKQYEIITLILIRRLFKDLSKLDMTSDWFQDKYDLQFTYDLIATIALFFLIFVFYQQLQKVRKPKPPDYKPKPEVLQFIQMKKVIATLLVPILLIMGVWSFGYWLYEHLFSVKEMLDTFYDINDVFFDHFFTVLILTDVLLLLISLYNTSDFSKVIRTRDLSFRPS